MTLTLTYLDDLSRVRILGTDLTGSVAKIERSTNQVRWDTVRGAASVSILGGTIRLDDYEFPAGVEVFYRLTVTTPPGATESDSITVDLEDVWLKSLTRPFLNRKIRLTDFSEVSRRGRAGIFDVSGRTYPVAVTDVRVSKEQTIYALTNTKEERRDLDLVLSSGDTSYLHMPEDGPVDSMYVVVGDVSYDRTGYRRTDRRVFVLPLTEVASPDSQIVGGTNTCLGVLNSYATCADVVAEVATCLDLIEEIADASDVIVP